MKRALALLVPVSLLFAACGGDDDATTATGNAVTVPSTAAVDDPDDATDDDGDDDGDDTGDVRGDDPGDEPADEASPPTAGGDPSSTYCQVARQFEETSDELDESIDPFDFSSDGFREAFDLLFESLDDIRRVAPDEIRADVATLVDGFDQLRAELEAVDYDFFAVDFEAFERFADELEAASDRIEDYNERVCGITRADDFGDLDDFDDFDFDDFDFGDDFDLGELGDFDLDDLGEFGDIVRQELTNGFIADGYTPAEAECLADAIFELDFTVQPDEMTDPFTRCGVDP